MKNGEYILKTLSMFGITQDTVDVIMVDNGINSEAIVDKTMCKQAMLSHEAFIRLATKRSVKEGGFSMSWSDTDEALNLFFRQLAKELGEEQSGLSTIKDISDKW